jgi:tetratricopeptide (TPR) repeat protein
MHESGDLPFAEEHYRAALALRPGDATAQFNLGVVLEDRGRFDEALAMYEATVITVPNHADAHFNAARLYDRGGNYEAALRHLRTYKSLTEA